MAAELILQDEMNALNGLTYSQEEVMKLRTYHRNMLITRIFNSKVSYAASQSHSAHFRGFTQAEEAEIEELIPGPPRTPDVRKRKSDIENSDSTATKKRKRIDLEDL